MQKTIKGRTLIPPGPTSFQEDSNFIGEDEYIVEPCDVSRLGITDTGFSKKFFSPRVICRHEHYNPVCGDKPLFKTKYTDFYAGTAIEIAQCNEWQCVVDCAGMFPSSNLYTPPEYESLQKFVIEIPSIIVPWPDFTTPRVHAGFWPHLMNMLPTGNVGVCCNGGHGRTGTALACLLIGGKIIPSADDAITWVRKNYCSHAIESDEQEDYIQEVEEYMEAQAKKK